MGTSQAQFLYSILLHRAVNDNIFGTKKRLDILHSSFQAFNQENTPRQNEHCLRNFDLAEYRQVFSDLAVWIYQTLIKLMEATIQPSIGRFHLVCLLSS